MIQIRTILAVLAFALIPQWAIAAPRLGVNMSGLEASNGGALYYTHVPPAAADIALAKASGVTLYRVPFQMQRIFPTIGGPAVANEVAALKATTDAIMADPNAVVILDDHSFGSQSNMVLGTAPVTPTTVAAQWNSLLRALGRVDRRSFIGLQNEPHKVGSWWTVAQAEVTALRAIRVENPISLDGPGYSAAYSWKTPPITDPARAIYFEPHVYFDSDDSGTHNNCVAGSDSRVDPVLADAKVHGYQVIFGEMAFGADPSCAAVRKAVLAKVKASPNVFGVTFWTLGNFALYPNYMFGLTGPTRNQPSVLMTALLADWNAK